MTVQLSAPGSPLVPVASTEGSDTSKIGVTYLRHVDG
ncbi:hypothetical protein SAMN05446935_8055 [Burkholderia sp. YR290]|nr:hypothetical protein SAMN05446935_8055 [Burkholderia sp. YR290]